MTTYAVPELSLILMIGPSGAGKTTFTRKHFAPTEIVSSDACRATVCDDENLMDANGDAFDLVHYIVAKRLKRGLLTVVDATNVKADSRRTLLQLAKTYHVAPVAIVLDMHEDICVGRNTNRVERPNSHEYTRVHAKQLRESMAYLKTEGFRYIHSMTTPEQVLAFNLLRTKLWTNKRDEVGPFAIIGDVQGCCDELEALLAKLNEEPSRKLVFLGNLTGAGPRVDDTLRVVMDLVERGRAFALPGKLDATFQTDKPDVRSFLDGLVSHFVMAGGKLVVAHAGLKEDMHGRSATSVRDFALNGDGTGRWVSQYRGRANVVYAAAPVGMPEWINNTININTGCFEGGTLTALRWPERDWVSVDKTR